MRAKQSGNSSGSIVVVGSSNTDLVLDCEHLPRPGETVLGGAFAQHAGGKGANQAVAAARAGARVSFVGARGDDSYGDNARRNLESEKIDTRYFFTKPDSSSGIALIFIGGQERENMIGVAQSANDKLGADDIQEAKVLFREAAVVLSQLEIPLGAVEEAARLAKESGALFFLNPAPARELPTSLLQRVDLLTPNETEAETLTGETDPSRAAKALFDRGVPRIAVTLGAQGVLLLDEEGERKLPSPQVKPLDTVGAGDCFCGYLAAGFAMGKTFDEAAKQAIKAASITITRKGAQAAMPHFHELEQELEQKPEPEGGA